MKTVKSQLIVIVTSMLLLLSPSIFSASLEGVHVTRIDVTTWSDEVVDFWVHDKSTTTQITMCGRTDGNVVFRMHKTMPNFNALYSALLTAKTTQSIINIHWNACENDSGIPDVVVFL